MLESAHTLELHPFEADDGDILLYCPICKVSSLSVRKFIGHLKGHRLDDVFDYILKNTILVQGLELAGKEFL